MNSHYSYIRKLLCTAIAASLLLTACGSDSQDAETTTDLDNATTPIEETTILTDDVPELDFDGAQFRTIEQESTYYGFYTEEANGDVLNDVIFERNNSIEERFNMEFVETVRITYGEISTMVKKSVMSGSDEFDLVFGQTFQSAADSQEGIYYDWNEVPHVDFTKPWYTKSIQDASVGDRLYLIESDLSIGYLQQTWMMLYNKTKAAELGNIPDLYQMVEDGTWTIDELDRLSRDVYIDVNGDTTRDDGDFYGFAGTRDGCMFVAFVYGCDGRFMSLDDDLNIVQHINSEKTISILEKLSKLFVSNTGTLQKENAFTRQDIFPKGIVLFEPMQMHDLLKPEFDMRNMADEFGVLPIPKYDAEQEEYYTVVDGGADIMVIPTTVSNIEFVGAIVEAMSAASYNDVIPVYMGQAIEQKGARDEESIKILREILDSRVIDFAYLYDGFKGWAMKLPGLILSPDTIASSIDSQLPAVTDYYEGVVELMTENE